MRLAIWNDTDDGKIALLRLESDDKDGVRVIAVDTDGAPRASGYLVKFLPNGKLRLHSCVNRELGFDLDADCRIKIDGTEDKP